MKNLVFNLRTAKAQAGCAKLKDTSLSFRRGLGRGFLFTFLLLTFGVGQMGASSITSDGDIYLFFNMGYWNWWNCGTSGSQNFAYFWGDSGNKWSGRATQVSGNYYAIKVPEGTWGSMILVRNKDTSADWDNYNQSNDITLDNTKNYLSAFKVNDQDNTWKSNTWGTYKPSSSASLSATSTSITTAETSTLTPSLSSNSTYNKIASTSYSVTTNPGSAGSVTSGGVFSATAAGTYTVTATVTYYPKGFSSLTSTATATKSITVTAAATATLTYNGNGKTGGAGPAAAAYAIGASATVADSSGFYKTRYKFSGWNTSQYITGTNYAVGSSITMNEDKNLYAVWKRAIPMENEDATTNVSTTVYGTYNCATLSDYTNPSKTGYTFIGWYTQIGGAGNYVISPEHVLQGSKTNWTTNGRYTRAEGSTSSLYATWSQDITLNANTSNHGSGSNTTATVIYKKNALESITHCTAAAGYKLEGYYTAATDGTKILNADGTFAGSNIIVSGDVYTASGLWKHAGATTLYAHYEPKTTVRLYYSNPAGWSTIYAYVWYEGHASDPDGKNAAWPGVDITTNTLVRNGDTYYYFEYYKEDYPNWNRVIFHNNSGNQTNDNTFSNTTNNGQYNDAGKSEVGSWHDMPAEETVYSVTFYAGNRGAISAKETAIAKNGNASVNIGATPRALTVTSVDNGYSFDYWETTGSVTVADIYSESTTVSASGTGTVTAHYLAHSGWYMVGNPFDNSWTTTNYPMDRSYRGISGVYYRPWTISTNNQYFKVAYNGTQYGQTAAGKDVSVVTGTRYSLVATEAYNTAFITNNNGSIWCVVDDNNKKMWVQSPTTYHTVSKSSEHGTVKLKEKIYGGLETNQFANGETIRVEIDTVAHYSINTVTLSWGVSSSTTVSMSKSGTKYVGDVVMPNSDATLTVTYTPWYKITLAASPSAGANAPTAAKTTGGASVANNSYVISGTSVTFTKKTANSGYTWSHWEHNSNTSAGTGNTYIATITADATVTAVYTENDYTVTVNAGEGGYVASGSVTGHKTTKVTLPTATAYPGYRFVNWTTTTGSVTYTNQTSANTAQVNGLTAAATVRANFARTYAYIEGRFHVTNANRDGNWTNTFSGGNWDENSTRIKFTWDGTNNRYELHTYAQPKELSTQIGGYNPYFYVKESSSASSLANVTSYWSSTSQTLTAAGTGNKKSLVSSGTFHNDYLRFNSSDESGYTVLYFDEAGVWYELEQTLKYNANGGTGSTPAMAYYMKGTNATAAPANTYTKDGYNFSGWKTAPSSGTSYAAGASVPMNSNITLYAQWTPKTTTVSFNANTSAEGYRSGSAPSNVTATYNAAMPSISIGVTAQDGYACIGYFDDPVDGTQYYDGTGTSVKNWDKTGSTATLYAHYAKAQITALTFSPSSTVAPNTPLTVTVTIAPTPTGTTAICWRLLQNNDNPVDPQPDFTWDDDDKQLTFNAPATGGTYKLEATLRLGSGCSGDVLNQVTTNLVVANDHTVTVLYHCGDATIKSSTEAPAKPLNWTSITAPDIVGYTFSKWKAGDGVTIDGADGNGEKASATINYKAIYDGTLTAIYTQKRMIYFYNTLNWGSVYVYFYKNDSYWEANGSGSKTTRECTDYPYSEGKHGQMLPVSEGSNIYYFDAEGEGVPSSYVDVVFTEHDQHNYDFFWQTNAVRRGDYKTSMPMFVPVEQTPEVYNSSTNYYNKGYWMNYPENTGYTLKLYSDPLHNNATGASREYLIPYSADKKMPLKQDVEINFSGQTWFIIYRNDGYYLEGTHTFKQSDHGDKVITGNNDAGTANKMTLLSDGEGIYTFNLSYHDDGANPATYNYYINVDFPAAVGDYRIVYKDNATWSQGAAHGESWYHPSKIITKIKAEATEAKKDTVSFFISVGSSPSMKFQKIKSINASTGAITWEDVEGGGITIPSSIEDAGVYNFIIVQSVDGTSISLEKAEPYTGKYYIRTDCAGNTKWNNYKSQDHQMTYTEFSRNRSTNTFGELYTHYYAHWCERSSNIQFVIANDYSPCISDTLKQDVGNPYKNTDEDGTLKTDGAALPVNDRYSANVRFMYNETTNKICRAYVASSTDLSRLFLVLRGNDEVRGEDNEPISDEGITNGVILDDQQNWIYERELKILPGTRFKLFACYARATPSQEHAQYFRGAYDSNQFTDDDNSVELVSGDPAVGYQNVRVIYDFKTNRLVSAWLPDNSSITGDLPIHADVMVIREHQEAAKQITFTNAESKLSEVLTVYGAMKFNRWILNNKSTAAGHAVLDPSDQKSIYERALYFISFPFDVNLSEVFGFGTYGVHWIIEYYDGLNRAKNGYWIDSPPNWKFVTNPNGYVLEAKKGYILCLDLDLMKDDNEDFWANGIETIELFFPSTTTYGTIQQTTATTPALGEEYRCTINRGTEEGDRRIKDSFWRCIGVPSFANYSSTLSNGSSTITWQTGNSLPYLYEWNMTDNTLTPQGTSNYTFKAMHAYLAQCQSTIVWTATSSKPSSVAARRNDSEALRNREFRLQLDENGVQKDQTFVRLSIDEAVTTDFEFGNDMSKEINSGKSNIYTFIGYERAAANSLPLSDEQITIVPVGVVANAAGEYTFSMPDGTDGIGVTLIDEETGIRTSLSALDYTITLDKGTYDSRFWLEISPVKGAETGIDPGVDARENGVRKVMIDGILYIVRDGKMFDARGARLR